MSTKAKKGTEQTFFDTFGDWSAADQDAALKVLNVIHDQTTRMERKLARRRRPGRFIPVRSVARPTP